MEPQAGSKDIFFLTCTKTSLINLHIENRISYLSIKKVENKIEFLKQSLYSNEFQPIINWCLYKRQIPVDFLRNNNWTVLRFNLKRINYESNHSFKSVRHIFLTTESLILAQDERWRCASYMQVEREAFFGKWKVADGWVQHRKSAFRWGTTEGNFC